MKNAVISKETLLNQCREMVSENGLSSISMRGVAERCNVALGSLYNYYPSKKDLLLAVIESVWHDIFHMDQTCRAGDSFVLYTQWIFDSVHQGMVLYPHFFTAHSISFASADKATARETMAHYFCHMKEGLLQVLRSDPQINPEAIGEKLHEEALVDYVLDSLLSLLLMHRDSCDVLLEMLRRSLYYK